MDFIVGLPKSHGIDTILVVVDRLSKYAHFVGLRRPLSAKSVAAAFCKEVVKLHGFPASIVSDRDSVFTSSFWDEMFRLSGTQLKMSSAYHPQTDGQTEVVNRGLETYLRCFASEHPNSWSIYLHWAELSYNTSHHSSTGMSPFMAVYGREPPPMHPYHIGDTRLVELADMLEERDAILNSLQDNIHMAQTRMKEQADKHRRHVEFSEGDMVFLKLQPYKQKTLAKYRFEKLSPRYFGPYPILKKIGSVAYKLQLPAEAKIHPIFHVSQLKFAQGFANIGYLPPLPLSQDGEHLLEPELIQDARVVTEHGVQNVELLIKWIGRSQEDSSWENYDVIVEQFPTFRLEDKAFFLAGSNVRPTLVYSRRRAPAA